jgi:hypothetical protein
MLKARRTREAAGALPDDLNERLRAFQESRAILTALEQDVFTGVGEGATSADVAAKAGTDQRAKEMLLNALTALGLLAKQKDRVWLANSRVALTWENVEAPGEILGWPRLPRCNR